jgi:hypothetical protein
LAEPVRAVRKYENLEELKQQLTGLVQKIDSVAERL